MKRIVLTLFVLSFAMSATFACDFCNCYLGLNPHYKKNTIGLRYYYMSYKGTHMDDAELQEMNLSKNDFWEKRNMVELHAQWYPLQKLQVLLSLPYIMNIEGVYASSGIAEQGSPEVTKGIGDPLVLAQYQLFNRSTDDSHHYAHRLLAGGGIKIPLGNYKLEEGAEPNERVHLPGTGSWDFLTSATYLGKLNRAGVNVNASYFIATTNNESFKFANRFNANAMFYYQFNNKELSIYPNLGIFYEQAGKDLNGNYELNNSGGTITYLHTGLDFYYHKFSMSTAIQLPSIQKLNENQPNMQYRFIAGISYALN